MNADPSPCNRRFDRPDRSRLGRSRLGMVAAAAAATLTGIIALLTGATGVLAQTAPDYSGFTVARFLPFVDPGQGTQAFTNPVALTFQVQTTGMQSPVTGTFTVTMDTGSTGVIISAADLPGYTVEEGAQYPQGWEFLSSSKLLWVGRWVPRNLVFLDAQGAPLATATVPVLAVEQQYTCPGYSETANLPICAAPTATVQMPTGIRYMGVGFGREHDGQPQGTPDKNPLLNITAIDGQPVAPGTIRSGYIVTPAGVHVGLTPAITNGFTYAKLTRRSLGPDGKPASNDPRDWPQATMAVSVNGAPIQAGSILIDTGIPQMYLTVSDPQSLNTVLQPNPSEKGKEVPALPTGAEVKVTIPATGTPAATYSFTVGNAADTLQPSLVIVTSAGTPAFVNTGRHFLRGFEMLYDADGGWVGFRPVGSAATPG
ncbi:MAG: hypothetical protein RLY86_1607 [Pseudomonadota bacterium]|jgi:hypothetical protein